MLDTDDFEEVERWQLSQLEEGGLGRFDFGFRVDVNEEPGFFSGVFRVQDPVQNRSLMGIARINLTERDIDFYTLGPAERVSSISVAPGRQKAYGLLEQIGHHEFWTFDLVGRRLENRQVFDGRPRMRLSPSTNGQILYVYGAGSTIDPVRGGDLPLSAHHHTRRRHEDDLRGARVALLPLVSAIALSTPVSFSCRAVSPTQGNTGQSGAPAPGPA